MFGGSIYGKHISILAPNESHTDCISRKGYHSIIIQAVVDHNHNHNHFNWGCCIYNIFTTAQIHSKELN